ncbi:hypothetical protein [Mesorhizobium sp. J18]|uniref:hypothetical protein n=1 Tax=Mesorhizobium sp. J18 TaxID=935263 RepID=UPI0011A04C37|nr:hypothetical protein [Mesorhizobium sp. J18]
MKDREIAELFAAQTAVMYSLVEELIAANVIDRDKYIKKLYDLLNKQAALYDDKPSSRSAPIRHLIRLIEGID